MGLMERMRLQQRKGRLEAKMAQRLGGLTALLENMGLVSSTHVGQLKTHYNFSSRVFYVLFWSL